MCVRRSFHPSFFVEKLWSYFIPEAPSAADLDELATLYGTSGYQVRPVLEAILLHPALYKGPRMVKPPAVFLAGMLRALRRAVDVEGWGWLSEAAGQRLFRPPDVSGWDDARWLDTSTVRGRWGYVTYGVDPYRVRGADANEYDATETAAQALAKARAFWGNPDMTARR